MFTEEDITGKIFHIQDSLSYLIPEVILTGGIILILLAGLIFRSPLKKATGQHALLLSTILLLLVCVTFVVVQRPVFNIPVTIFGDMLRNDNVSVYLKILFDAGAIGTLCMSFRKKPGIHSLEYVLLLLTIVLGAHMLVMSVNFVMVFLSLEVISISSYVLAGFAFNKHGAEASMKYFLFGSVSSAIMLYGFSILYGITGVLNFTSPEFAHTLTSKSSALLFVGAVMCLAGFFYKIAAVPMHPWVPDIYEAAPIPVVAFFSVVPKLAGLGILLQFIRTLNQHATAYDWQLIIALIALITLTVGNLSALWQKRAKRLMAYSSIAQSGFLLVGIVAFLPEGIHFMLFYATVYLIMNFLVFLYLQFFENFGIYSVENFAGQGRSFLFPVIALTTGLISLTGLPPTGGFMAKVFVFSSLWKSYEINEKPVLMWLLVIGLLNTVISLFYYLRIPYYAFLKTGVDRSENQPVNNLTIINFFGLILVLLILLTFIQPNLLMSWINRIKFVI